MTESRNFTTSDGLASPITSTTSPTRGGGPTPCCCCTRRWAARGAISAGSRIWRATGGSCGSICAATAPRRCRRPTGRSLLERLVSDVAELLDHLGLDSAHIVGNSAGGYLGQQLAMTMPARVKSLSLFGSTPGLKKARRRAGSRGSRRRACAASSPRRSATACRQTPIPASSNGFSTRRRRTTRPISANSCC